MAKVMFILNEAPYGGERSYNALRLAMDLQKLKPKPEIRVFLSATAPGAPRPGRPRPAAITMSSGC